jgi:hypothetical protein
VKNLTGAKTFPNALFSDHGFGDASKDKNQIIFSYHNGGLYVPTVARKGKYYKAKIGR